MKLLRNIREWIAAGLLLLGVISLAAALGAPRTPGDTQGAALRAKRVIEARLSILDGLTDKALDQNTAQWLNPGKVPDDMVIYRYNADTLQSWVNTFPQINDDIVSRPEFQNISSLRGSPQSPLIEVSESYSYMNLGSKWYLIKSESKGEVKVISALEVIDSRDTRNFNGVNPRLHIGEKYSIKPLSEDGGTAVEINGVPEFNITYESLTGTSSADPVFIWIALSLMIGSALFFLLGKKTLGRLAIASGWMVAAFAAAYIWGRFAQWEMKVFSPTLYAGGAVLYSLGSVIIINLTILLLAIFLFIVREDIYAHIVNKKAKAIVCFAAVLAVIGILAYTHVALKSIILNSGITLELYKLSELSLYTALVYASFLTMLMSVPLLIQLLRPAVSELFGIDANVLSRVSRVAFSIFIAIYLVTLTSVLGFRKEQNRTEMWANRIAFDRDISLEMRLERMEPQIAGDAVISTLSVFENTAQTIQNRLANEHFVRIDQGYEVSVFILNGFNSNYRNAEFFNSRIAGGVPISDNSRFLYVNPSGGHSYYAGVFMYSVPEHGLANMLITIEPKNSNDVKGYAAILGLAPPGKVVLPADYSYARYDNGTLQQYKGNYAYPMQLEESPASKAGGFTHFVNTINEEETVIISRPTFSIVNYLVEGALICLAFFFLLSLLQTSGKEKTDKFESGYYRSRISAVLLASLTITLVAMATASVLFVANRNDSNLRSIMSDKISAISLMTEAGSRPIMGTEDLLQPDFYEKLQTVASNSNSDITVFGPDGRVLTSTNPMVFERANLGSRIDGEAYDNIIRSSRRYYIQKEKIGQRRFYSMYAPIKGAEGRIAGIICSPYSEETYDFEKDAVTHSMTIVTVFLLLLLLARFAASRVIDRLFKPLSEMSGKMSRTNLDSLELVEYDRKDEISSLVDAYNLMVSELERSSKQLAQAERDKAWSGMARQVAHEIKNPLTPMKLQIQRIMRLKQKGDPGWQDKFDEVTQVLLDHIDILSETANEFSTFAKLYTEEPKEIDLDKILKEEISMFDNRADIRFEYIGLDGACVQGPKPQLTRVFVNLINNAVQAVEGIPDARVFVALRNSGRDGFYDIVVEDNGSGVSEENIGKLFTPNFTTKSGGTGLGLAISRSVLERCGASISYSKSFTLGGACFTIQYPKQA